MTVCGEENIIVRDNVIYYKTNEVSTTRAKWLATLVIDFDEVDKFFMSIGKDIRQARNLLQRTIVTNLRGTTYKPFKSTLQGLLAEVEYLDQIRNDIKREIRKLRKIRGRGKRSLLPFVGDAMSWLFGTVSQSSLQGIKAQIRELQANQQTIVHVAEQSLTVINESRELIRENRHSINDIIKSLKTLDSEMKALTEQLAKSVLENRYFLEITSKMDLRLSEIRILLGNVRSYLSNLESQLDYLSLGKISTRIINPNKLQALLLEIEKHSPKLMTLISDPKTDIWTFYRYLTSTTIFREGKILIVLSIPMIKMDQTYEVYRAIPVPIIYNKPLLYDHKYDTTEFVASYQLESNGFLIDKARQKYVLLSANELEICSQTSVRYCTVNSPLYTVILGKTCIINLFVLDRAEKHCTTTVAMENLPLAYQIFENSWAVVTRNVLKFALVCNAQHTGVEIQYPIGFLKIEQGCTASNEYLSLMATSIIGESSIHQTDNFDLKATNFSQTKIWGKFNETFGNYSNITIPNILPEIKDLPIDKFIKELKSTQIVTNNGFVWSHSIWYYVSLSFALVVFILVIFICCRKGKCNVLINCLPICLRKGKKGLRPENGSN